jgi:leader peptidase (prepilin peptidase)/N-methyltransferase
VDSDVLAAVLGAAVAGLGGLLVPRLIGMIPEIEPDPEADPEAPPEDPPEPFADIARIRGLAWRCALVSLVLGLVLGRGVGWHWGWLMWVPLVPAYVALALVDWRTRLLPTYVIKPLYLVVVALALVGWAVTGDRDAVVHAALGWLVYGGLFVLLWFIYPRGLGYGDVRLSGVLGLALGWLGWHALIVGLYAAVLLGGILGVVLALLKVIDRRNNPFGPYMLVGALVGAVWGQRIWAGLYGG